MLSLLLALACYDLPVEPISAPPLPSVTPADAETSVMAVSPELAPVDSVSMVAGANEFTWALYHEVARSDRRNLVVSPLGVSMAFGLAHLGARGETAAEIERVFRYPASGEAADQAMGDLQRRLAGRRGVVLRIANRLWPAMEQPLLPAYVEASERLYGAVPEGLDFLEAPSASRAHINQWVSEATGGTIKDLLGAAAVTSETKLVLTNAVYFLGEWADRFDAKDTIASDWTLESGAKQGVWLMTQTKLGRLFNADQAQVLALDYRAGAMSMIFVLPSAGVALPTVEALLGSKVLNDWLQRASEEPVQVWLPRFQFEWQASLVLPLRKLGLESSLGHRPDFSGMAPPPGLVVTDVIQKAFVKVDEKGTEASAATAMTMVGGSASGSPPPVFLANHPFVFAIRDNATGVLLFVGRVMSPEVPPASVPRSAPRVASAPRPLAGVRSRVNLDLSAVDPDQVWSGQVTGPIEKRQGQLRHCYERRLREEPTLRGRVGLTFAITNGVVIGPTIESNTTGDAPLGACIVTNARGWRFPSEVSQSDVYVALELAPG